ncbi:MAG: hypothetical protein H0W08_23095 [Acidobacteria bacterium]|nr:hypothetical protein [Acidobacteriota bacterium]
MTRYHRKVVIRLLRPPASPRLRRPRGRHVAYRREVVAALCAIWTAAGYPWSVRLKALLPAWVPWARRRLRLTAATERALLRISARQIDRRLQPFKQELRTRMYGRTKPGTLLKHHIPVPTERWNVTEPGFTEIDLVSHSGDWADGEFLHSLNVIDIHTTWVETPAVPGQGQERVRQALEPIAAALPFTLRGIDSDNGSEFINAHLYGYCQAQAIQFTRGRPFKKDDNAPIEQKNWTHVRKLVGYDRYDSPAAVAALNGLYADLRLLQNLWLPSVKLVTKTRVGSRVRRVYGPPQTPLDRVRACPSADPTKVAALVRVQATLDPFALAARIERQQDRLYALANHRRGGRPMDAARPCGKRPERVSHKVLGKPTDRVFHRAHRPSSLPISEEDYEEDLGNPINGAMISALGNTSKWLDRDQGHTTDSCLARQSARALRHGHRAGRTWQRRD